MTAAAPPAATQAPALTLTVMLIQADVNPHPLPPLERGSKGNVPAAVYDASMVPTPPSNAHDTFTEVPLPPPVASQYANAAVASTALPYDSCSVVQSGDGEVLSEDCSLYGTVIMYDSMEVDETQAARSASA